MPFFRPTIALLALALSGCNCKPSCFLTPVMGPGEINRNIGLVGHPFTVKLPVPGTTSSCGPLTFATSVTARVLDPNNAPIDSTTSPNPLKGETEPAGITFTPVLPGPYHVSARFDPGFGTTQTDVWIAADRSDAGVNVVAMPYECARWDQLGDQFFCLSPDAGSLGLIIDGGVVMTVPAYEFALSPETSGVWVVAAGDGQTFDELQFHLLDGGMLSLVDQLRLDDSSAAPSTCAPGLCAPGTFSIFDAHLLDRGGRALVLLPPLGGFASLAGGHVTFQSAVDPFSTAIPATPFAQWGPGDAVEVVGPTTFSLETCSLPMDGGQNNCDSQFVSTIGLVQGGATADAVWVFNSSTSTLDGIGFPMSGGAVTTHLPIVPPDAPSQWPAIDTAPHWTVDRGLTVLGSANGDLRFDFFTLDLTDATWWGVDGKRLWKWNATTRQLSWIDR